MKEKIKAVLVCAAIGAGILVANAIFLYVMLALDNYLAIVFPWSIP